ncbi:glycosyltransferase [Isoptericola sp. BMS4]|uniref:glycosyltransferase n=1 Tax=Isoptericola sp. BMS4 TaxID=2527875 RepID=UPI00142327ED|nr:glycosyltransferase [Isoptericola sp. BMS4]
MSDLTTPPARAFGDGTFSRVTGVVYHHVVVGALLCVATLPSAALLLLLDRSAASLPIVPLCLVPYGPALSAALYALRDRTLDPDSTTSPAPARSFVRGYRSNALDVMRLWVSAMVGLALVAFGVVHREAAGLPGGYVAVLGVIGAVGLLWLLNAVTIASFFSFRTRDAVRLAAYYLMRTPGVTVGLVALGVIALAVVRFSSELVLWLFAVAWVASWLRLGAPLVRDVAERFTAPDDGHRQRSA